MSKIESYTCDGCGASTPDGYWLSSNWLHIENLNISLDACSWECLATVAAARTATSGGPIQELVRAAKLRRMFPDDPSAAERFAKTIDEWRPDDEDAS